MALFGFDGAYDTIHKYKNALKTILIAVITYKLLSKLVNAFTEQFVKGFFGAHGIKNETLAQDVQSFGESFGNWFSTHVNPNKEPSFGARVVKKAFAIGRKVTSNPLAAVGVVFLVCSILILSSGLNTPDIKPSSNTQIFQPGYAKFVGNILLSKWNKIIDDPTLLIGVGFFITGIVLIGSNFLLKRRAKG